MLTEVIDSHFLPLSRITCDTCVVLCGWQWCRNVLTSIITGVWMVYCATMLICKLTKWQELSRSIMNLWDHPCAQSPPLAEMSFMCTWLTVVCENMSATLFRKLLLTCEKNYKINLNILWDSWLFCEYFIFIIFLISSIKCSF